MWYSHLFGISKTFMSLGKSFKDLGFGLNWRWLVGLSALSIPWKALGRVTVANGFSVNA
jgi:hypothetical protein